MMKLVIIPIVLLLVSFAAY
ncbi:type I toxin-antitoxin system Ibs family toxin [Escherichia coli]|nr:type I toxin-antitoxin system Ibs family toxin [Escherichia coli]EIG1708611.1 type I toxin-antitoxin system Ibs family toxin [Escherichia coli]EJI4434893.1 type I toxin-antitoxin system Ibs family toxin [Escherichia coli]